MMQFNAWTAVLVFSVGGGLLLANPAIAADDACVPVRAMISKFNAVPKVRFTQDVVNDGTGWSGTREIIEIGTKQYRRTDSEPWEVWFRNPAPPASAINCEFVHHETVKGVSTAFYRYDRSIDDQPMRIDIWISIETGLPVEAHFKALPSGNGAERHLTYTYGADIQEPFKPKMAQPPVQ